MNFRSHREAIGFVLAAGCILIFIIILPAWLKPQDFAPRGPLDVSSGHQVWPLLRCFADFVLGLFAYRLFNEGLSNSLRGNRPALLIVVIFAFLWLCPGSDLFIVLMFALLIAHLADQSSILAGIAGSKPLVFLGDISYAVYLTHLPVLSFVKRYLMPTLIRDPAQRSYGLLVVVAAVSCILLLWVCYVVIERPSRRILSRSRRRTLPVVS